MIKIDPIRSSILIKYVTDYCYVQQTSKQIDGWI